MELRQTPTHITYMCMIQPDGSIPGEVSGVKAKHALQIYAQWSKGRLNDIFTSTEDFENATSYLNEELKLIQEILKSRKKLVVYIL